ncbi:MAG: 16S rRNA (cytosine(1402)-N(4))-methyltransferase [Ilumatobacter coccineus]|uniref:Ribosomal RNA small subunit methyltransferase H n=1 Tax=Ilumatobacter coccineus TaxID=467094 RepID=A0A2G6KB36_9ACTN|nr:MAG: 16S rRNA (cytosine(1402)-N(4))-methyltransferase [Ilumatobacter coccineus]
MAFIHDPVMVDEIVEVFETVPSGVVLDATLGGGGHSEALLRSRPDLSILGLDRDGTALNAATKRLADFGDRLMTHKCRFDDLDEALDAHSIDRLSGAFFDLGVSSPQLDRAERGFSYRLEGPVDMRMDTEAPRSAADLVNTMSPAELARVLRTYGDERYAARIATAIVDARPITTTTQLAEVVTSAIPAPARRSGRHPAARTFQALRIETNGELDALPVALDAAIAALVPGGRVAVLSYHSGEDRIAKDRIRHATTGGCECPPELPCGCGAVATLRRVRFPKRATPAEVDRNRRASSARLRVAEKRGEVN